MSYEILKSHREIWQKKEILRDISHDWYRLIIENMADNSAIPTILFSKEVNRFHKEFPNFKVIKKELLTFISYPLSGGFDRRSFVSDGILKYMYFIENLFKPFKLFFAFRTFIIIEKCM